MSSTDSEEDEETENEDESSRGINTHPLTLISMVESPKPPPTLQNPTSPPILISRIPLPTPNFIQHPRSSTLISMVDLPKLGFKIYGQHQPQSTIVISVAPRPNSQTQQNLKSFVNFSVNYLPLSFQIHGWYRPLKTIGCQSLHKSVSLLVRVMQNRYRSTNTLY